jgi:hypothetical protein
MHVCYPSCRFDCKQHFISVTRGLRRAGASLKFHIIANASGHSSTRAIQRPREFTNGFPPDTARPSSAAWAPCPGPVPESRRGGCAVTQGTRNSFREHRAGVETRGINSARRAAQDHEPGDANFCCRRNKSSRAGVGGFRESSARSPAATVREHGGRDAATGEGREEGEKAERRNRNPRSAELIRRAPSRCRNARNKFRAPGGSGLIQNPGGDFELAVLIAAEGAQE